VSPGLYGVLAEFRTVEELLAAARSARADGYTVEAYSPFPVEGLGEAVGFVGNRMPLIIFVGGLAGGAGGYFMQWYSAVVSYPVNIGGRPLDSWPAFLPATVALTILGAAVAAVIGMLVANGLPRLHHPLFEIHEFDLATRNRFFACLRSRRGGLDLESARALLARCGAMKMWEVPA
jgi:hypothetical protein